MRLFLKIFVIWFVIIGAYGVSLLLLPHTPKMTSAYLNQAIQSLLFIISLFIVFKEPNKKNKFIFLNFAIYFALALGSFLYDFIDRDFIIQKYSRHLFYQYLTIAYMFFLAVAVAYTVFDSLFREFTVPKKYLLTLVVVLGFFIYCFHIYFTNPLYLYSTEDINQWKILSAHMETQKGAAVSPVEIANTVNLKSWHDGVAVGELYPEENLRRIEILFPYLQGVNFMVLLVKPLYLSSIFIHVFVIGFILLYFGYQYKKDPPQGAYIEKIMFLFLLVASMDAFHYWGFIKSIEWTTWNELFSAGQYITVFAEVMLILFFGLRLRFITSVQGEFYETELAANPQQISRWRDWIDNLILRQFSNFKLFNGRLFQRSTDK
jgi:hypothetical protein